MTNVQFDKMKGYAEGVKEDLHERLKEAVMELQSVTSEMQCKMVTGAEYLGTMTDMVRYWTQRIDDIQSKMQAIDGVINASKMVEKNFSEDV